MSTRAVDNPKVHIAMKTPPIVSQQEWLPSVDGCRGRW
jgi:hypothetical protein